MLLLDTPTAWMCHLYKPEVRAELDAFSERKDSSVEEFARFILLIHKTLVNTPAWGKAGTNDMYNKLTAKFAATRDGAKNGTSSAWAQARSLIRRMNNQVGKEAELRWNYCKLNPAVSVEELQQFLVDSERVA
jgi:hypothetical protein